MVLCPFLMYLVTTSSTHVQHNYMLVSRQSMVNVHWQSCCAAYFYVHLVPWHCSLTALIPEGVVWGCSDSHASSQHQDRDRDWAVHEPPGEGWVHGCTEGPGGEGLWGDTRWVQRWGLHSTLQWSAKWFYGLLIFCPIPYSIQEELKMYSNFTEVLSYTL